jgi:hypothetical protein
VTIEGDEGAAEGAAGEITSVSHAFQPSGRFSASNSLIGLQVQIALHVADWK